MGDHHAVEYGDLDLAVRRLDARRTRALLQMAAKTALEHAAFVGLDPDDDPEVDSSSTNS